MSDNPPICPEWWPKLLWDLHFIPRPFPGPNPVNYPPIIDDIMAGLHIHTMSYMMREQTAAQEIRKVAEQQLTFAVQNLHKFHEDAKQKSSMKR